MNDREHKHEQTAAASIEQALLRLKSMNVRLSPARLAILEALWGRNGSGRSRPSVAEITTVLAPRFPHMTATTVRNAVIVYDRLGLSPSGGGVRAG